MIKENIKIIAEKLELLNDRQLKTIKEEVESFVESNPATLREKLFRAVENTIYGIGDVSISNEHGVNIGIGTNLIYNEAEDENVSLCYMYDDDTLELHVNNEEVLKIAKDSPILEAFQELFEQLEIDKEL